MVANFLFVETNWKFFHHSQAAQQLSWRRGGKRKSCRMEENVSAPCGNFAKTSIYFWDELLGKRKFNLCCGFCVYKIYSHISISFMLQKFWKQQRNVKFTKCFWYSNAGFASQVWVKQNEKLTETINPEKRDSNNFAVKSLRGTEKKRFKIIVNFSIWQILLFHFMLE